jgi:hypothetical protein
MPARDRSLGLGKCNTQENIIDLPRDAFKKLAQRLILALKAFLAEMAHEWQRLVQEMKNEKECTTISRS